MAAPSTEVREKLLELRRSYLAHLPEEVNAAEVLIEALQQNFTDEDALTDIYRLMHKLNGSGMTFGFPEVSECASTAEHRVQTLMHRDSAPSQAEINSIQASVSALRGRVEILSQPEDVTVAAAVPRFSHGDQSESRSIAVLSNDPDISEELVEQLQYFGYTVFPISRLRDLADKQRETPPTAVILDLDSVDPIAEQWKEISADGQVIRPATPVVFVSSETDINTRLRAIRAGGDAYFIKPVNMASLVDSLDNLTVRIPPEPYRILIIEDDADLASYYASTLEQAGMSTLNLLDPLAVMAPLEDFRPDLVLMDLYMPQCSGLELASVIRQQPAYISVPLVFLSTETNLNHHMTALHMGGDDFLTKPIASEHLVASVTARVQRARNLRTLMVRDSLTGLLNHTTTLEHLNQAVARGHRLSEALSFVMIDIDHFKSVNDTYGHPTGDRVLKNLARLLQ